MGRQYATIYMRELLAPAAAKNMDMEQKAATVSEGWSTFLKDDLPKLIAGVQVIVSADGARGARAAN
jgi:hypothetical protein